MTGILAVVVMAVLVFFSVSYVWAKIRSLFSSVAVVIGAALFLYVILSAVFHDGVGIEVGFGGSAKSAGTVHVAVQGIDSLAGVRW
ncbi:hypothetical protein [Streptomyces sp. NBC_00057]|uniref:hypothetical protein n=1 Tax=Streptomyces sp. NBC_00057 TaxID=2975634 RepID=UPI002F90E4EF